MTSLYFIPLIFGLGTPEIIIIMLVVLLLFGGKKIPELMRGLGKGAKMLRKGMEEAKAELEKPVDTNSDNDTTGKDRI